jgi:hypothetical protein
MSDSNSFPQGWNETDDGPVHGGKERFDMHRGGCGWSQCPTMQMTDHDDAFMCMKHTHARTHSQYSPLYAWSINGPYTFFLARCTYFCKEQLCFDHKFGL